MLFALLPVVSVVSVVAAATVVDVAPGASGVGACVASPSAVFVVGNKNVVTAVDAATLKVRWRTRPLGKGSPMTPAALWATTGKDVVVVGFAGVVVGVDAASGKELWRTVVSRHPEVNVGIGLGVMGRPVAVGVGNIAVSYIGGVAVLDAGSGTVRHTWETFAGNNVLAAVDDDIVVYSDLPEGKLIARSLSEERVLWTVDAPCTGAHCGLFQAEAIGVARDNASVVGYVATNTAETWAIDLKTGRKLRGFETPSGSIAAPIVGDDVVVASGNSERTTLLSFERATGAPRFEAEVQGFSSDPVAAGDAIVLTWERGVHVVDRATGALRMSHRARPGQACSNGSVAFVPSKTGLLRVRP
jgi:outer membrane protein assembly factor BamB